VSGTLIVVFFVSYDFKAYTVLSTVHLFTIRTARELRKINS